MAHYLETQLLKQGFSPNDATLIRGLFNEEANGRSLGQFINDMALEAVKHKLALKHSAVFSVEEDPFLEKPKMTFPT